MTVVEAQLEMLKVVKPFQEMQVEYTILVKMSETMQHQEESFTEALVITELTKSPYAMKGCRIFV
ncbi:GH10042 [Drosophila grimshawi]|uniref:GH10042 n=1 Tax=Drosophila grimshawi TaxID=7222 RepID=B4K100_DROGR|nr:GH10042 [Drosophila grimshawi]